MAATARGYQEAMADPSTAADALMKASPELDRDLVDRSADYLVDPLHRRPGRVGPPGPSGLDALHRLPAAGRA